MCKDFNFQPQLEPPTWDDRLYAERTALVETYNTGIRHHAKDFHNDLPQGPLTEQEQDMLDDFSTNLGNFTLRASA